MAGEQDTLKKIGAGAGAGVAAGACAGAGVDANAGTAASADAGVSGNMREHGRMAVLVVDMLAGSFTPPVFSEDLAACLAPAVTVVEAAREAGIPVIFLNDAHIPGVDRELDLWGSHALEGTPEAQIAPEMGPEPQDYVIGKRRYSGFYQTGLELLLDELGIDTVVVLGVDTNICVIHTVADAYFRNYSIVIPTDATATFLVSTQADGLERMKVCYGAELLSSAEVATMMKREEGAR